LKEFLIRHAQIEDSPALARILIMATQEAFRGRVPDRCLKWITPEESAANWAKNFKDDHSLEPENYLFVAENEADGVIGLAMAGKTRNRNLQDPLIAQQYPHELFTLQVDPTWQGQGVGRRLVSQVAEALLQEDISSLLVRILIDNPNLVFYERLGAVRLGSGPYDWEGYKTEEILYGWNDLNRLSLGE